MMHDVYKNYTYEPIIVTGCARSGTSLIAGALSACGAWMGKVTGPTRWNRKGQFENESIRDRLTKPYLQSIGCDPMGQDPLPPVDCDLREPAWRKRVLNVIHDQGYDGTSPWAFKGAKATLIWPVWHKAFPEAKWVIVRRSDERIIDSCMKTSFMRKRTTRESWQEWIDYHKKQFSRIIENVPSCYEVWSNEIVDDPMRLCPLVSALGLKWDWAKVRDFVTEELWNG